MKVSFHCRGLAASVAILSAIILLVAAFPLGASAQAFQFRKGIGVHHALNWAAIDKERQYVFPPFTAPMHAMPPE